jgi:hypothetical protein
MMKFLVSIGTAIIVSVGGLFGIHKTPAKPMVSITPTQQAEKATTTPKPMAIKDFLTMKGSQKCTFSDTKGSDKTEGVVYSTGGKMRGDITTTVNGKTTTMHMIGDDTTMHMWMDGQSQGYTSSTSVVTTGNAHVNISQINSTINKNYKYNCTPSSTNESEFKVPSDVQFMDVSKMIPSIPAISTTIAVPSMDVKTMQCGVCDKMTGPAQAQCKLSLNCN